MEDGGLVARIEHHGISPWEIEVAHGYLGAMFHLTEVEIEPPTGGAASHMRIRLPISFSDEFFEWFGFKRWGRAKALFKEMKRRRGGGAGSLEILLDFEADPRVSFVIDSADRGAFDNSVEKLDYVLEVLAHHRKASQSGALVYRFSMRTRRWVPDQA